MSKQLIPFPFPKYLAEFLFSQMKSQPLEIADSGDKVKALHVNQKNSFGKLIYSRLKESNRPAFEKDGYTLYISVSDHARRRNKTALDGRSRFLSLDEDEIEEIIAVFKDWFSTNLYHFILAAEVTHKMNGKNKGAIHFAINKFMELYNISDSKTKFATFVKFYQRETEAKRQQLQRMT
ncbi:hypothetical protein JM79_3229 [Gramella sp. Hel_I_59]|uniref:hypothetical protein n=1 Tax=Gramella sp. Hel_I_59 TaxID=1249978 RepID=UPI00116C3642|nr:hypothetical protein [Gramella sp. Hel_I_59]TQI72272.1 hypothetical protein JM79_3229 [Gramella sp. Hel_I_59]